MNNFDSLKLDNQLCFPLYACSKEIVRLYKPFLDEIDVTYTQYIVMMVMWETDEINVKNLGERLYLDSGTLTPLLKKLETKGYITRHRSNEDERNVIIKLTPDGSELKNKAVCIPEKMSGCVHLSEKEAFELYRLLHKVLDGIGGGESDV